MASNGAALVFINLDRASDRRAFMEAQGARLGLTLERLSAFGPDDIAKAERERLAASWERPLSGAELGLFFSHKVLWERCCEEMRPLVILEDDAVLSRRLPAFLASLPAEAGERFDLINLEYIGRRKYFGRTGTIPVADGLRVSSVARDKAGSAAYLVTPRGARKLLLAAADRAGPSDAFLFASGRLVVGQAEPALAIQAHILKREGFEPPIDTASQIGAPRRRPSLAPKNAPYHWRRLATQLSLLPYQAGRLTTLAMRKPQVDFSDFV